MRVWDSARQTRLLSGRELRMDSDFRIRSGILYVLLQASTEGHTYLPEEELTRRTGQLL